MKAFNSRRKVIVTALICVGVFACAYASYDGAPGAEILRRAWNVILSRPKPKSVAATTLVAGDVLRITPGHIVIDKASPAELDERLSWAPGYGRNRWLEFQGQTLGEAVAEFNRHNRTRLSIDNPAISGLRIGGNFLATDVEGFLAALEETHGVEVIRSRPPGGSEVIVITGRVRDGGGK